MIWTATAPETFCATGIGWYGEPGQHGWDTCAVHSRTFSVSSLSGMPSSPASRRSTAAPPSACWARFM